MIKAILFDMDGVLIDSHKANLLFFQKLFETAGYQVPTEEEYAPLFPMPMWDSIKKWTKASDDEVRRIWELGKTFSDSGLITLHAGVQSIIHELRKKYRLGIVTSRIRQSTEPFFKLSGTKDCFECVICYEDCENHKPHPDPLLKATQNMGINVKEAIYIGDAQSDVIAAKAAGMQVIMYKQKEVKDAEAYIESFEQ